jgi:hypothetical protein
MPALNVQGARCARVAMRRPQAAAPDVEPPPARAGRLCGGGATPATHGRPTGPTRPVGSGAPGRPHPARLITVEGCAHETGCRAPVPRCRTSSPRRATACAGSLIGGQRPDPPRAPWDGRFARDARGGGDGGALYRLRPTGRRGGAAALMINFKHSRRPVGEVLDELGEYVLPHFPPRHRRRRHALSRNDRRKTCITASSW